MDRPVTRHELSSALARLLERSAVASPESAIEVLGPPHESVRLFGILLSERARPAVTAELVQITGRLHPTVADMWLLTERDSAALIQALQTHRSNPSAMTQSTPPLK